MISFINY